jgi:hypothetical protein
MERGLGRNGKQQACCGDDAEQCHCRFPSREMQEGPVLFRPW